MTVNYLELLVRQIRDGTLPEMSAEMHALATAALRRMGERKDENIEEWAQRLAASVADAND